MRCLLHGVKWLLRQALSNIKKKKKTFIGIQDSKVKLVYMIFLVFVKEEMHIMVKCLDEKFVVLIIFINQVT